MSRTTRTVVVASLALAALVVLLATAGGIIATIVVPTSVSTDYYTARVALSPSWQDRSAIGVETIVGGASARFTGLAPGAWLAAEVGNLQDPGAAAARDWAS